MARLEQLIEKYNSSCVWCGKQLWSQDLTVEHFCPRSRGGSGLQDNCLLACQKCNNSRKSKSAVSFARSQEQQGLHPQWNIIEQQLTKLLDSEKRKEREWAKKQLQHFG